MMYVMKNFWSGMLAYKGTLEKLYFIDSESKGEVSSSKIDQLAGIYTSKFKWAWRAQFLSHTLQILEIIPFFEAVKTILIYLVKILLVSDIKKWKRPPWMIMLHIIQAFCIHTLKD